MAILIYGVKKTPIGVDEVLTNCPSCEVDTYEDIYVTSNYYHMFFIPIFPIEKEVTFFCQKCGLRRTDIPLTPNSIKNFQEVNKKFRHPWYTYFFLLFILAITLIPVLYNLFFE